MSRRTIVLGPLGLTLVLFGHARISDAHSCSASVTDIDFGSVDLLSTAPTDAIATIAISCTGVVAPLNVKMCPNLGDGTGTSNGSVRLLDGPANQTITFQLYQDASHTTAWGSTTNPELGSIPPIILTGTASGAITTTVHVYSRLFGSQPASAPGKYMSNFTGADSVFEYTVASGNPMASCVDFVGVSTIHPSFDVSATPAASCTLGIADLGFPTASVLTSELTAHTSLHVTCTSTTPYSVGLDNGRTGTSPAARTLTSAAGGAVTYALYRDPARSLVWGTATADQVTGHGTGTQAQLDVYGLVPVQATPASGAYSDRVVVTLTY